MRGGRIRISIRHQWHLHKVLTDTLRRAERDGFVARQLDPGRVETATLCQLTEPGVDAGPKLRASAGRKVSSPVAVASGGSLSYASSGPVPSYTTPVDVTIEWSERRRSAGVYPLGLTRCLVPGLL
jgi:hypothetical protein